MARSRRKSSRGSRVARPKMDWVVNATTYGRSSVATVPNLDVAAFPLTYPKMMLALPTWAAINIGGNAMPTDGDRQFVKAVSGFVTHLPNAWVAGTRLQINMRIVKKPMDITTQEAIADGLYSLGDADYANERFAWQDIKFEAFNTGANFADRTRVVCNVNQWLEPDEALFLIVEPDCIGIASITFAFYLRTLMRVD